MSLYSVTEVCIFGYMKGEYWQYSKDLGNIMYVLNCKPVHGFKEKYMQDCARNVTI